jgi:hypothetical protein
MRPSALVPQTAGGHDETPRRQDTGHAPGHGCAQAFIHPAQELNTTASCSHTPTSPQPTLTNGYISVPTDIPASVFCSPASRSPSPENPRSPPCHLDFLNMAGRAPQGGRPGGSRFAQFKLVLLGELQSLHLSQSSKLLIPYRRIRCRKGAQTSLQGNHLHDS